eukprot:4931257-Alexandrium_andersonii.AAC.1
MGMLAKAVRSVPSVPARPASRMGKGGPTSPRPIGAPRRRLQMGAALSARALGQFEMRRFFAKLI